MKRLLLFFKFAGISGIGWLADAGILISLVGLVGMHPFYANLLSSSTAALFVFITSRMLVFKRQEQLLGPRLLLYWMYTICVIFTAASAIQCIVNAAADSSLTRSFAPAIDVAIAKILVTPPQLLLNFCVARFLIERPIGKTA